ncbi:MAG: hypothetical protein JST10_14525 [Bacteroidetes bacterium]|nr:hypothetical protein [Bacteroidota bacterium]MBS1633777.1 hypothetical protein [Bacteroidota bacterium]
MNKNILFFLFAILIVSCNLQTTESGKTENTVQANHEEHRETDTTLSLNNGARWKIDSSTAENVNLLKEIIAGVSKSEVKDFAAVAGQLQEGLNQLIRECKMKGADHDALHKWLEPLLDKVKALKAANTNSGSALFNEIAGHVQLFDQYFER